MSALPLALDITAPTAGQRFRRRFLGHYSLVFGTALLGLIVFIALAAPWIAPYDPYAQVLADNLIPPVWHENGAWTHPLGTDHLGRDYLSRIIFGARISLMIGFLAALVSGVIGTALGVAAGYFRGKVDLVVTFLITVRLSMPVVIVALATVAIIGGSLQVMITVIGLLLWDRYAVVVRSATMQACSNDYVAAARAVGCSTTRIVLSEVLPNVLNHIIIVATLEMAHAILLEAALSFLGLGVQPPLPSWGLMISEGRQSILFDQWLIAIPGLSLMLLVFAINMVGDGMRDVTAPENRA